MEATVRTFIQMMRETSPHDVRYTTGTGGTVGRADESWLIRGGTIDIECKDVMILTNKSTLPRESQTREGQKCINAGGVAVAIDNNNMFEFRDVFADQCNWQPLLLLKHPRYKENFCITNWGLTHQVIEF